MAIRFMAKAGMAVFSWDEGPMKAQWELKTGASEEEIMEVLASLARFVKGQPASAQVIELPLHAVPPLDEVERVQAAYDRGYREEMQKHQPPAMTWTPAVKARPLDDSIEAASQNGFELIPEGEE